MLCADSHNRNNEPGSAIVSPSHLPLRPQRWASSLLPGSSRDLPPHCAVQSTAWRLWLPVVVAGKAARRVAQHVVLVLQRCVSVA